MVSTRRSICAGCPGRGVDPRDRGAQARHEARRQPRQVGDPVVAPSALVPPARRRRAGAQRRLQGGQPLGLHERVAVALPRGVVVVFLEQLDRLPDPPQLAGLGLGAEGGAADERHLGGVGPEDAGEVLVAPPLLVALRSLEPDVQQAQHDRADAGELVEGPHSFIAL